MVRAFDVAQGKLGTGSGARIAGTRGRESVEYRGKKCMKNMLFLIVATSLCLCGCGESAEEEIPVDFPFYETEEFTLTLVPSGEDAGEYLLLLCDENGQALQEVPCGRLTEPMTFSYDGIGYGHWRDLEIFSSGSDMGVLFMWKEERFSEKPIEIPRYMEIRSGAMLTVTEDGERQEKRIYQLNEFKEQAQEVRSWSLNRDSGTLRIWDCLREQSLYEGNIALNEEGEPLNREYYEYLFWQDRDLLWDYSADPAVRAWLDDVGHAEEYESRQAFLDSCGYAQEPPFYQYHDRFGNLQLELYLDKKNQKYYGITYLNSINCDGENVANMLGFTVHNIRKVQWEEGEVYPLLSVYGTSNPGEGYQEDLEYTESGKPYLFLYEGLMQDCGVEYLGNVVAINYIYREDGTLFCRDYRHDALTFSSTLCSLNSFFDEKERLVYEIGYITHGSLEYYYIYEDDTPTYCLCLDYNGGYVSADMVWLSPR